MPARDMESFDISEPGRPQEKRLSNTSQEPANAGTFEEAYAHVEEWLSLVSQKNQQMF